MAQIEMYRSDWCPYCMMARRLLDSKGVSYTTYSIDGNSQVKSEMMNRSGRHTVPQIFIDGSHIGGFDDLAALDSKGGLDPLLGTNP